MTKQPLPRYRTTLHITIDVSAATEEEAEQRLDKAAAEIQARTSKTTFTRLPGKPSIGNVEWFDVDAV